MSERGAVVLVIDNYDSFVHNLARYVVEVGGAARVVRNDAIAVHDIDAAVYSHIILSPGPCTPKEAGVCVEIVRELTGRIPILGVCLGHQCIAEAFGANVVVSGRPMHGKVSDVFHDNSAIFSDIPSPSRVTRYHSLVVDPASLPPFLKVTARTADGTVMAISHSDASCIGLQFHPEAALTDHGHRYIENFLGMGAQP